MLRSLLMAVLVSCGGVALASPQDFVEFHSARVQRDMLNFTLNRSPEDKLLYSALDIERERDRVQLFHVPAVDARYATKNVELSLAVFTTMTMLAAHMPSPLRGVFDNPAAHFGPAIFTDGGMGAGIGGEL